MAGLLLLSCGASNGTSRTTSSAPAQHVVGGGGQASCVYLATFRGERYLGRQAMVQPVPGEVLGEALVPGCNDTGGVSVPPDEHVSVSRLPGVDPSVGVVSSHDPGTIFVREDVDPLPAEIMRLLVAPACGAADAPIDLSGTWMGIIGADGKTELDMVPPYDVEMQVERASAPTYERADISIRVPASLGQPLTREDVRSSLWKGGTIHVVAECDGDRFVVQQVEALPPG